MHMNQENFTIYQDVLGGFDVAVEIERTEPVTEKISEVSRYVNDLPLTRQENDRLVELLTDMVNTLEHDSFLKGAVFGRCWLVPADGQGDDV